MKNLFSDQNKDRFGKKKNTDNIMYNYEYGLNCIMYHVWPIESLVLTTEI